jgi:hypothetical protein
VNEAYNQGLDFVKCPHKGLNCSGRLAEKKDILNFQQQLKDNGSLAVILNPTLRGVFTPQLPRSRLSGNAISGNNSLHSLSGNVVSDERGNGESLDKEKVKEEGCSGLDEKLNLVKDVELISTHSSPEELIVTPPVISKPPTE